MIFRMHRYLIDAPLKLSLLVLSSTLFAQEVAEAPALAQDAVAKGAPAAAVEIRSEALLRHARYLASEELNGRLTGSPGQKMAAKYIAAHFEELGLEPLGDVVEDVDGGSATRSFLQHYGIKTTSVGAGSSLEFGDAELLKGFAVLGGEAFVMDDVGKLRFCGVGRTRGSRRDLPEGESLEGKIAVVAIKPPKGRVPEGLSVEQKFGMSFGVLGRLGGTARNLGKLGAKVVLFVQVEDKIGLSDVLNYVAIAPGKANVAANFPGADPGMGAIGGALGRGSVRSMVLSVAASADVLAELGIATDELLKYFAREAPCPEGKTDVDAAVRVRVDKDDDARASNVVAVLRGSDPELRDEAIVYSAHMDHVGVRMDGVVFNGADDNASGSAGLLAIATAYAKAKTRPRRSVIFLSVSGEELGLWGSQFYSDNPTWQLDKIVANINTDMIGRSGPESGPLEVTVTPSYRHAKYSTIVRDSVGFAKDLGMSFTSGDKYYARSDHYNFAKKGIPVVFFCTGEHEDYHQVSDTGDKLDGMKMQRIAQLAFWTGWHVASADKAPSNLGRQEGW